jgi:methionyl-tRNA formyltransferase
MSKTAPNINPPAARDLAAKPYKITILSDRKSWMRPYAKQLRNDFRALGHKCVCRYNTRSIGGGDFCFYLSYERIVSRNILDRFRHNLVVHESDLPRGKGWSPLTWQIMNGLKSIPIVIFEASSKVDSGPIYYKSYLRFRGDELVDELRAQQGCKTLELCRMFVRNYPTIVNSARSQKGNESFYRRRRPSDSKLDLSKSLRDQFNLLRVVDNDRYPAFFRMFGKTYELHIKKQKCNESP